MTRSLESVTLSRRSVRALQAAARAAFVEVIKADWSPLKPGGIMCGPEGGWVVEIRDLRHKKFRGVACGMNLSHVCEDIKRAGASVNYLANNPPGGISK